MSKYKNYNKQKTNPFLAGMAIIGTVGVVAAVGLGIGMGTNETFRTNVYDTIGVVSEVKYNETQESLEASQETVSVITKNYEELYNENSTLKSELTNQTTIANSNKSDSEKYNSICDKTSEFGSVIGTVVGKTYELQVVNGEELLKVSSSGKPYTLTGSQIKEVFSNLLSNQFSLIEKERLTFSANVENSVPFFTTHVNPTELNVANIQNAVIKFFSMSGNEIDINSFEDEVEYKVQGIFEQCSVELNEDGSVNILNFAIKCPTIE